jgi:DNA-binding GntR family transcriptional regulator
LSPKGVVTYEINRGYVVAKLDDDDLGQIHQMRTLLEDELLRSVKRPDAAVLSDLKDLNEKMMVAIDERNIAEVLRYNREFHFAIEMMVTFRAAARSSAVRRSPRSISRGVAGATVTACLAICA